MRLVGAETLLHPVLAAGDWLGGWLCHGCAATSVGNEIVASDAALTARKPRRVPGLASFTDRRSCRFRHEPVREIRAPGAVTFIQLFVDGELVVRKLGARRRLITVEPRVVAAEDGALDRTVGRP